MIRDTRMISVLAETMSRAKNLDIMNIDRRKKQSNI